MPRVRARNSLPSILATIQLPPLPGSLHASGDRPSATLQACGASALQDSKTLIAAGVQGLVLQNTGDAPFLGPQASPAAIGSLAILAAALREVVRESLGLHVLRDDPRAALHVAAITECDFIMIRVGSDFGEAALADLLHERRNLGVTHIRVLLEFPHADSGLLQEILALSGPGAIDAIHLADPEPAPAALAAFSDRVTQSGLPLFRSSTASAGAEGVILGSEIRQGGRPGAPIDRKRLRQALSPASQRRARSTPKRPK